MHIDRTIARPAQPSERADMDMGEFAQALHRATLLMEQNAFDAAEREYAAAVLLRPTDPTAQFKLAKLRYMRGDPHFARDLVAAAAAERGNGLLQLQFADILRQTGDLRGAEILLRDLMARAGSAPELHSSLAVVLQAAGRLQEAESEARTAAVLWPTNARVVQNWVAMLLAQGRADEALPVIRAGRVRAPFDYTWIAHEAIAARLLGDPAYDVLYDYERLVGVYDLAPPPGWSSMTEFNAALAAALRAHHTLARHPFDQSMRFGTQSMGNLVRHPDAVIQCALEAFGAPIAEYRAKLGNAANHPLSARNRGAAQYAGCWSVQLKQGGFHVNHIHPEGWLSSAYYVVVPTEASDTTRQSGWLSFGEPALPVPGASPALTVQPRQGRLVLFPSYMWHGTTPIRGMQPRLTMAFDVITNNREGSSQP